MDCETVTRENIAERYLAGTLDPQLKEQWELHYFGCERCAQELATWQEIEQPLRSMVVSIRQEIRPRKATGTWIWAGAAIAAALLVGLGVKMMAPSGQHQPQPQAAVKTSAANPFTELARMDPPAYQPPTLRAAGSQSEVQFHKAMEFYTLHDYPQAIAGLRAALDVDGAAAAPRFFLGACELLTGNTAEGAKDLERVAGDSPFAPEAQFDLAKAYLLQGNREQAVAALRRLTDVPGDFREPARQLLTRIIAAQ